MKDPANYFTFVARKEWRCRFTYNYNKVMRNRIITVDNVTPFGTWEWLTHREVVGDTLWIRKRWNVNNRWDRLGKRAMK